MQFGDMQQFTEADLKAALTKANGVFTHAAEALGVPRKTFTAWLKKIDYDAEVPFDGNECIEPAFTALEIPDGDLTIDELLDFRKTVFARKAAYKEATRLIPVKVNINGPIGILHFGDPHVDDDGTDIVSLERDTDLCRNVPGMFGANIGDTTNNWVGRLARLYADQSTTAKQAWKLAEWFLSRVNWLYCIEGNHDLWSGAGSPIPWIVKKSGSVTPPMTQARIGLQFKNGREVRINARHDFEGSSQWNPAHAVMKAAQMGYSDHLFVCGHMHKSGYGVIKDPHMQLVSHCLQLASYKIYDRYAEERGFRDQHISPAAVTIIDPDARTEVGLIQTFFDTEEGADFLTYKRKKAGV